MSFQSLITFSNPYVKIGSSGQLEIYDVCGKLRIRLNCNGSIQIFNSDGSTQNIVVPDSQLLTKNNTLDDSLGNVTISGSLASKNNVLDDGSGNVTLKGTLASKNNTLDDGAGNLTASGYAVAKSGYSNNGTPVGFGWYYANDPSPNDIGIRLDSPAGTPTFKVTMGGIVTASGINTAQAPQSPNRSLNTAYPNNSGKNLFVSIGIQITNANGSAQLNIGTTNQPSNFAGIVQSPSTNTYGTIYAIVPNGYWYKVVASGVSLYAWTEQTF
jgi:hypothetical protein